MTTTVSAKRSRVFSRGCGAVAIAVAWGGWLAATPAAAAVDLPLDPEQVYHLYFVDVASLHDREKAFLDYVGYRWRTLVADDDARKTQKGRIVFIDGPTGRAAPLDLRLEDRDQDGQVKKRTQLELGSSRAGRKGLDLGIVAEALKEAVVTRFDAIAAPEVAKSTPPHRLLFVHVIADELLRPQGNQSRRLDNWAFPESCMEDGAATTAAARFEQKARETFKARGLTAPQLKIVLELVSSDDRTFGDAGERSAAQVLLGRSALDGRAIALRDGLSCVEVKGRVAALTEATGPCIPHHDTRSRPARTRETCLPLDAVDTLKRVGDLIKDRHAAEIAPFVDSPVLDPTGGTVRVLDPPRPEPAKPEPQKIEPQKPEPQKPEPQKPEPQKPEPQKPEPQKIEPQKPEPQKIEPQKPEPQKIEPQKPEPQKIEPQKPEPQRPEPQKPEPQKIEPQKIESHLRLAAAAARAVRPATGSGWFPLSGRASVTDGGVTVHLVPLGRTLADADSRRIVDVTRDVTVRPAAGVYSLVARLGSRIGCDASGRFSFSYSLTGNALQENGGGEFVVDVPDACRRGGGDVLFGKVTIR